MELNLRNAGLEDLATMLKEQQARKIDVVAPATAIRSKNGMIVVEGTDAILGPDGVTTTAGTYKPTTVFYETAAEKLGIPTAYLKKLAASRPDLFDANVNGWLHGRTKRTADGEKTVLAEPDTRKFLFRGFRGDDGSGIGRALLSDGFGMIEHVDVLFSALEAARRADASLDVVSCDLTERRMKVRFAAPSVRALAPTLLANYRNPFDGDGGVERAGSGGWTVERAREAARREGRFYEPGTEPIVFAGFDLGNSETGGGALTLCPVITAEICGNGLKLTFDAIRKIHLGARMDEGVIDWTEETKAKSLELVGLQTRDAIETFLRPEYVKSRIEAIEAKAGKPVEKPVDAVKIIGKQLRYSQEAMDGILDHFVRGGQMTAGGVLNAVTSYAQTVDDADEAEDIEASAIQALEAAYALN